jgi:hypothetical protein
MEPGGSLLWPRPRTLFFKISVIIFPIRQKFFQRGSLFPSIPTTERPKSYNLRFPVPDLIVIIIFGKEYSL